MMELGTICDLRALIERLANANSAPAAPIEAEQLIVEILSPLLHEEGFVVESMHTGLGYDHGYDFVARSMHQKGDTTKSIAIQPHSRRATVSETYVDKTLSAMVRDGHSSVMFVTGTTFTQAAFDLARRHAPLEVQLLDIGGLHAWLNRIEDDANAERSLVSVIRRDFASKLIELVAKNSRHLENIEWREMEHILTEVFEGLGFKTKLTPCSRDGGKDIILSCQVSAATQTYYVEVKHWRSRQRVGQSAVADFLNVLVDENVSGGLFLSTYGFSPRAAESLTKLQRKRLRFGTEEKVISLCDTYVKARSGLWESQDPLPNLLMQNTH